VLALVLPGEIAAHPHISKAVAASGLGDSLFERVGVALLIDFGRTRLAQDLAQIDEVRLCGGAFG